MSIPAEPGSSAGCHATRAATRSRAGGGDGQGVPSGGAAGIGPIPAATGRPNTSAGSSRSWDRRQACGAASVTTSMSSPRSVRIRTRSIERRPVRVVTASGSMTCVTSTALPRRWTKRSSGGVASAAGGTASSRQASRNSGGASLIRSSTRITSAVWSSPHPCPGSRISRASRSSPKVSRYRARGGAVTRAPGSAAAAGFSPPRRITARATRIDRHGFIGRAPFRWPCPRSRRACRGPPSGRWW